MRDLQEQLTKYLADAHSIEVQALAQLRTAPDIVADPELSAMYREHLVETEAHERATRLALEARDAKPSRTKDAVMAVGARALSTRTISPRRAITRSSSRNACARSAATRRP